MKSSARMLLAALAVVTGPTLAQEDSNYPKPTAPKGPAPAVKDKDEALPGAPAPSPTDKDAKPEGESPDSASMRTRAYQDDNMAKGDYYMKTGYYLKASEAYRVAVLGEPVNPYKKLQFGHALFAIGNYSYASYALRRAVAQLDPKATFSQDVSSLFPSKQAFEKAVKDLKRYVTYSPRDPAGLSVLGYMLFAQGEDEKSKEMFTYLQRLPKNENDTFAAFFMKQLDARKNKVSEPVAAPAPPPKPVEKKAEAPRVTPPEASRQDEEPALVKPAPAKAIAE